MTKKNTLLLFAGILGISIGVFSIFLNWNDTISGGFMGMGIGLLLFNLNHIRKQQKA